MMASVSSRFLISICDWATSSPEVGMTTSNPPRLAMWMSEGPRSASPPSPAASH